MPKLIITMDGAVLREYPIESDSIAIGRRSGNDIQLNDLTVSGRHALLTTLGQNAYVDDLGSTNGTLVNGKRVNKALLKHGDVVQIGSHQFTYFSEDEEPYEPTMFIKAEFEPTKVIDEEAVAAHHAAHDAQAGAPAGRGTAGGAAVKSAPSQSRGNAPRGEPLAAVKVLNGPLANKVLELRKPFNTLGFNGAKMAMIARTATGYTIAALKGIHLRRTTDVPVVNGEPLGKEPLVLKDHDVIDIAGTRVQFYYMH